jgi:membrane associated rhomboid family serine protease
VGVLIGLLYGAQILGEVLPSDERISWQAHLYGFLGGVVAAVVFRRRRPRVAQPGAVPALDLSTED